MELKLSIVIEKLQFYAYPLIVKVELSRVVYPIKLERRYIRIILLGILN